MSRPDPLPTDHDASLRLPERKLQRLLVGYDRSNASAAASSFGLWLASKADAQLTLLHVCDAARAEETASPELIAAAAEQRLTEDRHWRQELDNLRAYAARKCAGRGPACPRARGQSAARRGPRPGRRPDPRWQHSVGTVRGAFLGSVSSQVVEHAECSVMIFREGQAASPAHTQSIVVGVDGSAPSAVAVAWGVVLARWLDAKLVLVYAYQPTFALVHYVSELRRELRHQGADVLQSTHERITATLS
jgi:nucleotide-binding universal stress UspA family protein